MSLINDALKRAKQTQADNPPGTPSLEFRVAEPEPRPHPRTTLLLVGLSLVVAMILGLAGLLIWFIAQSKPAPLPIAARMADAPLAPLPKSAPPVAAPAAAPTVTGKPDEQAKIPGEPNTNGVSASVTTGEAIPPAALKLQGIFFNPNNPSAVVGGKTVDLGDRVNGFRVIGISPVAVTLVSATETNVLSLSGQ